MDNQKSAAKPIVFCGLAIIILLAYIGIGTATDFYVALNDFWGILFYAQHMDSDDYKSLYNGIYPIGYPLLLKALREDGSSCYPYLLNCLFAIALLLAMSLFITHVYGWGWGLLALCASALQPLLFAYAHTNGPYIGSVAFTAVALYWLWRPHFLNRNAGSHWQMIAVGILLGLAALWRFHAIVSSAMIIVFYCLLQPHKKRSLYLALSGAFVGIYSLQITVNLLSGHGILETANGHNAFKLIYGINWHHPPKIEASPVDIIWQHPWRFLRYYIPELYQLCSYSLPALLCASISNNVAVKKFSLFAACSIFFYAIPVALGKSPRASLVIAPLYLLPSYMIIADFGRRLAAIVENRQQYWVVSAVILAIVGICSLNWLNNNYLNLAHRLWQKDQYRQMEELLVNKGMSESRQVYTDFLSLYFPHTKPHRPIYNGGWEQHYLYNYDNVYPQMPLNSIAHFAKACTERDIRFLVLTAHSKQVAPFLYDVFRQQHKSIQLPVEYIGSLGAFKIFALR